MRGLLLLTYVLLCGSYAGAQEFVTRNIKTDFGALGDGVHNDHQAFMDASAFFNERQGHGKLIIPRGTYIVGKQLAQGDIVPLRYRMFSEDNFQNPQYKLGLPVLLLSGCTNISIVGEQDAVLKFADGLELGTFEGGRPVPLKDKQGNMIVAPIGNRATIGDAIYISHCTGLRITNLELDGNSPSHIMGGNISSDGWQWGQTGVMLEEVSDVKLTGLNVHHFAVDGLQLRNTTALTVEATPLQQLYLDTCSFEYNGRQGFSWTGGSGLIATACTFSHTGRSVNRSINGTLSIAPGAGLDIEPESDKNKGVVRMVSRAVFNSCSFEGNTGVGMIADLFDRNDYRVAEDMTFNDCIFRGTTFWSIWVTHPGFVFNRCRIYGSAVHSYDGGEAGEETRFLDCSFDDIGGRAYGNYLVEIADGKGTTFERCTFTSHGKKFYYLVSSDPKDKPFIVRDCTFVNASGSNKVKECIAEGVKFQGDNKHINKAK